MPRRNPPVYHERFVFKSSCKLKRRFRNEREAKAAADHQMLLKPELALDTYKCDLCPGWHLTRRTK